MTRFDVVGFGALNVDKLFKVNKIAIAEEESFVTDFKEACGGSAANTTVGLARLGCKVGFIGKVADDREGRMLLKDFRREGVDTSGITVAKCGRSGTAMGFVDEKGQRALYVDPGVNDTIEFKETNKEYVFKTKFLHLTSFIGEKSFQAQKNLIKTLPKNVKISFDPGELYARKGATLEPIIKKTFVLMPHAKELGLLTGTADYKKGADILCRKGVKIVAVKLGSKGCYITDGKEKHLIEAFKVKVVDTTGAGDAFCAGFLYGLISGKSLYECGRISNFVASRCIMKMGARTGLPHLEDLELLH
ncbi:MAG: carbohydrate kinase family protein [Candidatus Bathyarchaeota archaeon]|nr:carbohydrate kinase family protein [Candidatus Bathyarchaeota archaeon]MDH5746404.1 carbohydrate kinase family protein [Candidatus Bathyarchaeota archaeon]